MGKAETREIEIKEIEIGERGRQDMSRVEDIAKSIKKHGLLHPIVVMKKADGGYVLVAGECRLRACVLLGRTTIRATLLEDLTPRQRAILELEENIVRKDLSWPERVRILKRIDDLQREEKGSALPGPGQEEGWSLKELGQITGLSVPSLSIQINLAKKLSERPDLAKRVEGMPMTVAMKVIDQALEAERVKRLHDAGRLETSGELRLGDARELIKELDDESVDLIITDPPYGIEGLEGSGEKSVMSYTTMLDETDNASIKVVIELMTSLAPEMNRVLKPSGHLYVFFQIRLYKELNDILGKFFEMSKVPIIWDKGRAVTPFMGYFYASSHEQVLFGHKPPRKKRLNNPGRDLLLFRPEEVKGRIHPFQKPLELIRYLINQSSNLGETVLDPFVGSGTTVIAAEILGRKGIGFEMDEETFHLAQERLRKVKEERTRRNG